MGPVPADAWPMPVPAGGAQIQPRRGEPAEVGPEGGGGRVSSRRRARVPFWRSVRSMVQAMVVALNYLRLGRPGGPPGSLSDGRAPSAIQAKILDRLVALAARFARLSVEGCGRKLSPLIGAIEQFSRLGPRVAAARAEASPETPPLYSQGVDEDS